MRAFKHKAWYGGIAIGLLVGFLFLNGSIALAEQHTSQSVPVILLPKSGLSADEVAVIVNTADKNSVEIARYYLKLRKIPDKNLFEISFTPGTAELNRKEFQALYSSLTQRLPANIQALVLTWNIPYRVDCMSITTAFAMGFSEEHCANGCEATKASPYYDSNSLQPFTDHAVRPAMMLAGESLDQVKQLIQRGLRSDGAFPSGTGYLVETSDRFRNTRSYIYDRLIARMRGIVDLERINTDYIKNRNDVLFYFIGAAQVEDVSTNVFLPGAIADHLTSKGGMLDGSDQMSSLAWLSAGATGSYGAVIEPCNFPQKFPNLGVVVSRYLQGESLIEAYWKSVEMPGQGLFIGEPLATPFGGYKYTTSGDSIVVTTYALRPGSYSLEASTYGVGPYKKVKEFTKSDLGAARLTIKKGHDLFYRVTQNS
ncbi:MAG TPA: TIGR03790 family protein [Gammaproteobacteria bacterium]